MYESPLHAITQRMVKENSQRFDDMVLQEVINVGVNVDRDELIKALAYDRDQYNKGYEDGVADGKPKWISVKERLPKNLRFVLAYIRHKKTPYDQYRDIRIMLRLEKYGWLHLEERSEVTHWMPMPQPPEEDNHD